MNLPPNDAALERALRDVASVTPTPEATARALAAARAAITRNADSQHSLRIPRHDSFDLPSDDRPRRRWLLPTAIAAAIAIIAGGLALTATFQHQPSPAQRLERALAASQSFHGWIHLAAPAWDLHLNPDTGQRAAVIRLPGEQLFYFENTPAGEVADYSSATRVLRLAPLPPRRSEDGPLPVTAAYVFAAVRETLNDSPAKITLSRDSSLDRFDLAAAAPLSLRGRENFAAAARRGILPIPAALWVDPASGLVTRTLTHEDGANERIETTATFTYGAGPQIDSIYALGVPRDATIQDNRPPAATRAIIDRLATRFSQPLPDGAAFLYTETSAVDHAAPDLRTLACYVRTDGQFVHRTYNVAAPDAPPPDSKRPAPALALPDNWANSGAGGGSDLLARLRRAAPVTSYDGYTSRPAPRTGELPLAAIIMPAPLTTIAPAFDLSRDIFPIDVLESRYRRDTRIDTVTAPERPGLVGVRLRIETRAPGDDDTASQRIFWLDPAHQDRLAARDDTTFTLRTRTTQRRVVTNVTAYLAASDGRDYPAAWTTTTYEPHARQDDEPTRLFVTSRTRNLFRFFPDLTPADFARE